MSFALSEVQLEALAEDAWLLRFADVIEWSVNERVQLAAAALQANLSNVECVPAYASVLLRFEPAQWLGDDGRFSAERLRAAIADACNERAASERAARVVRIPVCYDGIDLPAIAAHTQMSVEQVIARHSNAEYRVAMLGFAPGFPYLLGLDPALATPRLSQPRILVPAGSVAIGGLQTGIYPQDLPGGWQLLGRTPMRLFDVTAPSPSLLQPGDQVRFHAIEPAEFQRLASEADAGR